MEGTISIAVALFGRVNTRSLIATIVTGDVWLFPKATNTALFMDPSHRDYILSSRKRGFVSIWIDGNAGLTRGRLKYPCI